MHLVKSLSWRWDRQKCILWGDVAFGDGQSLSVGLPLAHVVATFEACAAREGVMAGPFIGDVDSVDGLFSSIKRLAKKAGKAVSSAVKSTTKVLARGVETAARAAKTVARSQITSLGIKALAVAVPFVGVPALAAHRAANEALNAYDRAKSVAQQGARTAQQIATVKQGQNVVAAMRRLSQSNTPAARLAVAALKRNLARR